MGWDVPIWAHIPLDSRARRQKALETSRRPWCRRVPAPWAIPAAGMRNYLARLGWSHGDDEFFSDEQARDWFDLGGIGKSPARFDFKKLENICGQHIAASRKCCAAARTAGHFCQATGQAAPLDDTKISLLASRPCPYFEGTGQNFPGTHLIKLGLSRAVRPPNRHQRKKRPTHSGYCIPWYTECN